MAMVEYIKQAVMILLRELVLAQGRGHRIYAADDRSAARIKFKVACSTVQTIVTFIF